MKKRFSIGFFLELVTVMVFVFIFYISGFCANKKEVVFISEKDLPRKIAILGPFALQEKNIDISAFGLVKNVIKNYMSGKGYVVVHVDESVPRWNPDFKEIKKIYSRDSNLDGVLLIGIHQLSRFNIAFAQYYKMDGELCLYNKKKKLGCWRESATRKKVSIATDPLGAIATVVSSVISSSGSVHIKNIIFEWAFKISSLIPTFSSAAKKPKIFRVITNITQRPFKIGDKILVGIEGSPGGSAFFEISPLIKKVPMSEVQNGIYKGMYVVKEGDKLSNGVLHVVLENDRGEKRDWMETSPLINIDGIPPAIPSSFSAIPTKSSIKLTWNTTDSEVVGFLLFRSLNPLSGYKKIAEVKSFSYEDRNVKEGEDYFYRLIALDRVGNESKPAQVGPVTLPVFTQKPLPSVVVSSLASGNYYLKGTSTIPLGSNVKISNSKIVFYKGARLRVEGNLTLDSVLMLCEENLGKGNGKETQNLYKKASGSSSGKDKNNEDTKKVPVSSEKQKLQSPEVEAKEKTTLKINDSSGSKEPGDENDVFTGIEVSQTGILNLTGVQMENILNGIRVRGKLIARRFSVVGGYLGVFVNTLKEVVLESGTFKSLKEAVKVKDGSVKVEKCKFEANDIGLSVKGGEITLLYNNFTNNNINITSDIKLKLARNFLGSTDISKFKLKGKFELESFLDAPYPSGKEVKLGDLLKKAKEDKKKAIEFLNKRNYGKAVELFKKIISINPDVDTYIYYIYALSMIGDRSIESVINEAIEKYPYETKIYQLGIRYYLQANELTKAKNLWKKGLKLNPGDPSLTSMSYYFQGMEKEKSGNTDTEANSKKDSTSNK